MAMRNHNGMLVSVSFVAAGYSIDVAQARVSGEFFGMDRNNDPWSMEGAGPETTRVFDPSTRGTCTVTVPGNAPQNQQLNSAYEQDQLSQTVVGTLVMRDPNTGDEAICFSAFIMRRPRMAKSLTTRGEKTWVFGYGSSKEVHGDGGNPVGGTG